MKIWITRKWLLAKAIIFTTCPVVIFGLLYSIGNAQTEAAAPDSSLYVKLADPLYFWVVAFITIFGLLGVSIGRHISRNDKELVEIKLLIVDLDKRQDQTDITLERIETNCKNQHKERSK